MHTRTCKERAVLELQDEIPGFDDWNEFGLALTKQESGLL